MYNLKNLIFDGQLTAQQEALSARIDESLETIMENPQGFWYDMLDIAKYKGMLKTFNEQFRRVFPVTKGLYAFQSDYYSIQTALENKFKLKVTGSFTYTYSKEVFRFAFLHELAIYLHHTRHQVLYPVQVRAITIWLLIYYFDIKNFKYGDYTPILAYAQELMDVEMAEIEAIWAEINLFRKEYDEKIREFNAEKARMRGIVRKAKRCVTDRLMAKELEFHHFMAQRVCHIRDYREQLNEVAKRYHLALRTVKKRAKEIGLSEEVFSENLSQAYECYKYVELEKKKAQKIIDEGPLGKSDTFGYYKKRFSMFRTFWSLLTPDMDGYDEVQQQEHDRWLDEVNKSSNELLKAKVLVEENDYQQNKNHADNSGFMDADNTKGISPNNYFAEFDAKLNPLRFRLELPIKPLPPTVQVNSGNTDPDNKHRAVIDNDVAGNTVTYSDSDLPITEMTPEIVDMIMNSQSNSDELPQITSHVPEPEEPDWERILAEIDIQDECASQKPIQYSQSVNIESVIEDVMKPSVVSIPGSTSSHPVNIEDVLDRI